MAAVSFFAQQERARQASTTFIVLYVLSVAAIVVCVNLVVALVYVAWFDFGNALETSLRQGPLRVYALAPARVYLTTSLVTLVVIALGTLEVLAHLRFGKGELALMLAGRQVNRGSRLDDERRLVNVVDEIAIASGLSAPPLYVLSREPGINAFTAGLAPSEAIVVVTRGALEQLSRDELQAVIAHEFSHILNGDIRINLRAVYVLQGIVFLSAIGRFMMQFYSGAGTEEGRRFVHLPFAAIGAGVFAVGSVGLLFCRVIQSALARERENLADASAVQFTRNADALCGALARIKLNADGSRVFNWHADALAHMLFAPNARGWLRGLFSTHPPIEERMRRINPHLPPEFYIQRARKPRAEEQAKVVDEKYEKEKERPKTIVPKRLTGVAAVIAAIGMPQAEHLAYASDLLAYLAPPIREALADPLGAQAVMIGCLIEEELSNRERQLSALRSLEQEALARKAEVIAPHLRQLDRAYRLPLIALAVPALKGLDEAGRGAFLGALRAVVQADQRVTLSEFVLATILEWTLGPKSKRTGGVRFKERAELAAEAALVLSLLAHCGAADAAQAQAAFDKGGGVLGIKGLVLTTRDSLQLLRVSGALERLAGLPTAQKERLLEAFATAVMADENVKLLEHELLRAIACVLDCPMPPAIAALDPRLLRK